jgi:predicted ATPase
MLKKLTIRNFKAIQDVTIEFTPLTVLIGENGCGKSTILQAIEFLHFVSFRDISEYFREKGWGIDELKSQLNDGQNKPIEFISVFEFIDKERNDTISWTFHISQEKNRWNTKEEIINLSTNEVIFSRGFDKYEPMCAGGKNAFAGSSYAIARDIEEFDLQASWLKYTAKSNQAIILLKEYLFDSLFIGLLSTESIKKGDEKNYNENIGINGSSLFVYIHKMTANDRKLLDKTVSKLINFNIKIETVDVGKRIELFIHEKYGKTTTKINNEHISDGILRIIAFVAISLEKKKSLISTEDGACIVAEPKGDYITAVNILRNGMLLLDEIENGINPYKTEDIVALLRKTKRQIIITTHSPVILNDFKPEEIIFLWKDKSGSVHAKQFFETEEMRDKLDYLNPGEIWENFGRDRILTKLGIKPEEF